MWSVYAGGCFNLDTHSYTQHRFFARLTHDVLHNVKFTCTHAIHIRYVAVLRHPLSISRICHWNHVESAFPAWNQGLISNLCRHIATLEVNVSTDQVHLELSSILRCLVGDCWMVLLCCTGETSTTKAASLGHTGEASLQRGS